MAINVLEVIRQGQVGGGESHLLDLIAGFDNRVNPIVLSFTGGQMIDALTQRGVKCHVVNTSHPFDVRITRQQWSRSYRFIFRKRNLIRKK